MGLFRTYGQFIGEASIIDPDLEDIRHYRGSFLQFKDFWERKMKTPINPHGKVEYQYPHKRTEEDNSMPYQDFINGTSSFVKYMQMNRKKGIKNEK